ncbi:MAG: Holliday junction branch migration protein RuvA [Sphingobacteriia bacterium]|nr:Holliday junction branch migration protein RuvA [Sphingobacteriia bacterium]
MFARLTGKSEILNNESLIIDVSGVGYLIGCSERTISKIDNENISLHIETVVREDQISLYGFIDKFEHDWFKLLVTVKGIGPKLALTIIGHANLGKLANDIITADKASLSKISGVGPRTAERIIVELKDKVLKLSSVEIQEFAKQKKDFPEIDDSISALIALGYNKMDATKVVNKVAANQNNLSVRELVRLSLKELGK